MSQENVEIVRQITDGWSRGDFSVASDVLDPDIRIIWLNLLDVGEDETRGLEAANARMAYWVRTWKHITLTAERIVDVGDRVLLIAVWRAQAADSGIATEWRHGEVWTFRDGKVTEVISYPDPGDALAAVRLSE